MTNNDDPPLLSPTASDIVDQLSLFSDEREASHSDRDASPLQLPFQRPGNHQSMMSEDHIKKYLNINLGNCRVHELKQLYSWKKKTCLKPNVGVLGASKEISEVMVLLDEFMSSSLKDQKERNRKFKESCNATQKAQFKANAEYLSLPGTKVSLVKAQAGGEEILQSFIASNQSRECLSLAIALGSSSSHSESQIAEESDQRAVFNLDDEKIARIYCLIDFEDVGTGPDGLKLYKQLFKRKGSCLRPNFGIRGYSKDPKEVILKIRDFMELSTKEQKRINVQYRNSTSKDGKADHRRNIKFLSKPSTLLSYLSTIPRGREIAEETGLDYDQLEIDDDFESGEDEEEVLEEHMGLVTRDNDRQHFDSNRTDKVQTKRHSKPKKGQEPKSIADLGRMVNEKAEYDVWRAVATANNGTYLKNHPPGAPRRTCICVTVNEVLTTSKEGGRLGKKQWREKTDITVVANNPADYAFVMQHVQKAVGKRQREHHDGKYNVHKVFRSEETADLGSAVEHFISKRQEKRKNPQRAMRAQKAVLHDIANTMILNSSDPAEDADHL